VAASGHALIAVGGSYGTLAEMGFALRLGRPVVQLGKGPAVEGVVAAATPREAVERALELLVTP
jgi:predicted Rossmann-fold nucleotide-binding protein